MIDLSIIIPHYNSVDSLKKLLISIPKNAEIQIIVVDDNSNKDMDKLKKLRKSLEFDHVQFCRNSKLNKGAGACRNIGLKNAKGKWVLFADADDYFIVGFYDVIKKYFQSDQDVIYFTPTSIKIDSGEMSDRHLKYEKLITDYLNNRNKENETRLKFRFFVPWSKLLKRDFLKENDIYFDEVMASNDIMFSSKVGYNLKKFEVSTKIIYCVTRGFGTLTTNKSEELYDTRVNVFIENYKYLKGKLSKEEFEILHLHGIGVLLGVFRNQLGIRKGIEVYNLLKKNNVKILDNRLYNPVFLISNAKVFLKKHFQDKKYYKQK